MRTGRVSSREAERATRRDGLDEGLGRERRRGCRATGTGSVGKSSARRVRRWKVAGAADQLDVLLGAAQLHRQLLARAASGRRRAAAGPGARPTPGRSTSALSGTRRPMSMSVASSSGGLSGWAEIITPESACTALRVEATRYRALQLVRGGRRRRGRAS